MGRLDQATDARLGHIFEEWRGGSTELTGKAQAWRDEQGQIQHGRRFGGGFKLIFPELEKLPWSPKEIALAIERGSGDRFTTIRSSVRDYLSDYVQDVKPRKPEKRTVKPHQALRVACKICGLMHGKNAHRFHGKGSFHRTHLWGFPKMPSLNRPKVNFWTEDSDGERWLINGPELVIANRPQKRKGKKMYTNRRKPRHGTKAWMSYIRGLRKNKGGGHRKKHSRAKRNYYSAGEMANRPRTRTVTRYVTRSTRRNKASAGGSLGRTMFGGLMPGIEPIAGAFAGLAVPPIVNYFVSGYIPASIAANPIGRYAIKAAEVALPSWLIRRYVNRNVGTIMMIAGFGKLLFDAVAEFAPGIPGLSGMGYQPMLGAYAANRRGLPTARPVPMMQSPMIAGVPDRLNPQTRF
jgi:hypothetical protein